MNSPRDGLEELAAVLAEFLPDRRIGRAVADVYERVDREVSSLGATCWNRGQCCNFGRAGHRLYVTTPELIYFGQTHKSLPAAPDAQACPHQMDGACHAREARPLGCRVYFCQASARWWQPPMTEKHLAELRALGDRFDIPYAYTEWLDGLRAVFDTSRDTH